MGQIGQMIVRKMLAQELDSTMILFNYYRDEAIQSIPRIAEEYDEDSMVETVRTHASKYQYCWFNALEGQRPVGFIAGYITQCPWNKQIITANISFIFMLESHRSMENFRALMIEFTGWARMMEATEITAGDIGINFDRSRRLYEHLGFKELLIMTKE